MKKFDALILIDCWDEHWIQFEKLPNKREFYGRLLDFVSNLEFNKIFFCSGPKNQPSWKTHIFLEHFYPQHRYILDIEELKENLSIGSTILVGGQAWQVCLHHKKELNFMLLNQFYEVYSHPKIVDGDINSIVNIDTENFMSDILLWEKRKKFFYLVGNKN